MGSVIKGKLCDIEKSKFAIISAMLHGNLLDTWSENVTPVTNTMVNKVNTDKAEVVTHYEAYWGPSDKAFGIYLMNIRERLFDKFAACKQKEYKRNGLTKPHIISVKQISSRFLALRSYLSKFPEPDNKAFTTGDMIEIVLCMIPKD